MDRNMTLEGMAMERGRAKTMFSHAIVEKCEAWRLRCRIMQGLRVGIVDLAIDYAQGRIEDL